MYDPVVSEVFRQAIASPVFSCVLRYNQRGVGLSSGRKGLRGKIDAEDVGPLCDFLLSKLTGSNRRVFVVGYSFGACLATAALSQPRVTAYAGVSFPLGGMATVLQPRKHLATLLAATHMPRLLVFGNQDQYARPAAIQQLVIQQAGSCSHEGWVEARKEQKAQHPRQHDKRQQEHDQGQQQEQQQGQQHVQHPQPPQNCSIAGAACQEAQAEAEAEGLQQPQRPLHQSLQEQLHVAGSAWETLAAGLHAPQLGQMAGPSTNTNQEAAGVAAGHPAPVQGNLLDPSSNSPTQKHDWQAEFGAAPLLHRTYDGNDHFWLQDCSRMAEDVVGWLETVALLQAA
ncbi:hypothetical protein N2152v2_002556 [Parachlorella kessleri]